jgi:hypothetical protein
MQNRRVSWLKVTYYVELLKQWEIIVRKRKNLNGIILVRHTLCKRKKMEEKQRKDRKENHKKMEERKGKERNYMVNEGNEMKAVLRE